MPTDGLQQDLFGETQQFGVTRDAIQISCHRTSLLDRTRHDPAGLTVEQQIYAEGPAVAADVTRQLCDYESAKYAGRPLPQPVGDVSCGAPGDSVTGGATVYFHVGRTVVRVSLGSHEITGAAAVAKLAAGVRQVYRLLDR